MRIFRISLITIIILVLFTSSPLAVPEEETKTVDITIDSSGTYVFTMRWEENDGDFALISPEGVVINKDNVEDYGTYKKNPQQFRAQYIINNVSAGDWKVVISKATGTTLGNVSIDVTEIEAFLTVSNFEVTQDDEENLQFSWSIINTESDVVHVKIGYDYDTIGYDGVEIIDGYYDLEETVEIDPYNIHPDEYYFYIKVEDDQGIIAYKYSNSIEVYNNRAPNPVEIESVTTQDNNVTVRWNPSEDNIDGYRIYYYINDGQGYNLLNVVEVGENENKYTSEFPYMDSNYKVGLVAYNYSDLESRMSELEFNFQKTQKLRLDIQWVKGDIINNKNLIIPFTIEEGNQVTALHNDEVVFDNIRENGALKISLDEGMNHISLVVEDSEGNKRTEERGYYLDSTPPQLMLNDDYSSEDIIDSIITVSGRVELGAELLINNQVIKYDKENGEFEYDLQVSDSITMLDIIAQDEAGNITQYQNEIEFSKPNGLFIYLPHMILGVLALVILLTYYIKKRKGI